MGDKSGIEWTDATWNPTTGCDKVSPGCDNCYAMTLAPRLKAMGSAHYQQDGDPATSGPGFGYAEHPDALDKPLRWTRPRRIFVNSMSDLFHSEATREFQAEVFAVMAAATQHTFQVLTKRPGVMASVLSSDEFVRMVNDAYYRLDLKDPDPEQAWPLPNVHVGTSVEDQERTFRIDALLRTPAAVRFLSMEPLLGPTSIARWIDPERECNCRVPAMEGAGQHASGCRCFSQPEVGWVIVGGESGPGARPMDADWVRKLRDECVAAGVPFHFKQWGSHGPDGTPMHKKAAGRVLDGRTWDEAPAVAHG